MIEAIVFDMDGLLFDTERLCMQAWDYAGERLGIGRAGYMALRTLGMTLPAAQQVWRETFGDYFDQEAFLRYSKDYLEQYYREHPVPVKPGAKELLAALRGTPYRLAVASSSSADTVRHHLNDAGMLEDFPVVISGDQVTCSKPDPEIYLRACEALHAAPADCLALEDSRNGLHAAARAGCRPVMIPDLWQPDEETKALLFARLDSLHEVLPLLRKQ